MGGEEKAGHKADSKCPLLSFLPGLGYILVLENIELSHLFCGFPLVQEILRFFTQVINITVTEKSHSSNSTGCQSICGQKIEVLVLTYKALWSKLSQGPCLPL